MARRVQLKGCKKNRHKSKAGKRCRSKRKKSVIEKRRLRLSEQDTLLNEYYHLEQEQVKAFEAEGLN